MKLGTKMVLAAMVWAALALAPVGQAATTVIMDETHHNGSFTNGPTNYGAGFWYNTPTAIPTGWTEIAQNMYTTGGLWEQCGSLAEAVNNTGELVQGNYIYTVSADLGGAGCHPWVRVYATQNANGTGNKVLLTSVDRLFPDGPVNYTLYPTTGTPGPITPSGLAGYYIQVKIGGPYDDFGYYISGYYDKIVVTGEPSLVTPTIIMDATHHNGSFTNGPTNYGAGFWYNTPTAIPTGWVEKALYMYTTGSLWVQCGSTAEAVNNTGEFVLPNYLYTVSADLGGGDGIDATVRVYATKNADGTGDKVLIASVHRPGIAGDGYNLFNVVGTPGLAAANLVGYYVQVTIGGPYVDHYIAGYYDNIVVTAVPEPITAQAMHPDPGNGASSVGANPILSWSSGKYAASHDVYFSSDMATVQQGSRPRGDINGDGKVDMNDLRIFVEYWLEQGSNSPSSDLNKDHFINGIDFSILAQNWLQQANSAFKGNQTSNSYTPGTLELGATYYWRIDEVNDLEPNSPWQGTVWQFTTAASAILFQQVFDLNMGISGAAAWADYDNDGFTDLIAATQLWKNNSGTSFSKSVALGGPYGTAYLYGGDVMGDFNNDGFVDVFSYSDHVLYKNVNGVSFAAEPFPILPMETSCGASWADYDGDGYIDLYVGGYETPYQPDAIVSNNRPINLAGYYLQVVLDDGGYYDNVVVASQEGKIYMDAAHHNGTLTSATTPGYWSSTPSAIPTGWTETVQNCYTTNGGWVQLGTYAKATNNTGEIIQATTQLNISADLGGSTGCVPAVRAYATQNADGSGTKVLIAEVSRLGNDADGYNMFHVSNTGSINQKFVQTWTEPSQVQPGRGITSCDFDEDGDIDIYVSNYRLAPNYLWRNNGSGIFTDVASAYGVDGAVAYWGYRHTIGSCWGDLDNDGHFDLFVGNFAHPAGYFGAGTPRQGESQFFRNLGPSGSWHFQDMSATAGLAYQESYLTPTLGDYDNDGYLDLFFTTGYGGGDHAVLYHNNGNWTFTDVTSDAGLGGLNLLDNYQAAWADINNDGFLDLATAGKIYKNLGGNGNHWLEVRLHGDGVNVNRSAIGAQIRITMPSDAGRLAGKTITRQVEAGTGQGNENDLKLHFGLGSYAGTVDLVVSWPDGTTSSRQAQATNQTIVISR